MKADIQKRQKIYDGFFTFEEATVSFEQFNGEMSKSVSRLHVYRGDAAAVLLYNSQKETLFFVRQFRYPLYTFDPNIAWPLEIVAGSIEKGHSETDTAVREVEEEVGFSISENDLQFISKCWPSPGGTSEQIYCYAADIATAKRIHDGGGLEHEVEDIQVVELTYKEAFKKINAGEICDAKTLICLQWLQNRILTKS